MAGAALSPLDERTRLIFATTFLRDGFNFPLVDKGKIRARKSHSTVLHDQHVRGPGFNPQHTVKERRKEGGKRDRRKKERKKVQGSNPERTLEAGRAEPCLCHRPNVHLPSYTNVTLHLQVAGGPTSSSYVEEVKPS